MKKLWVFSTVLLFAMTFGTGTASATSASAATLTSTGSYGNTAYTFNLTIPFTESAGAISNTINFVATAN